MKWLSVGATMVAVATCLTGGTASGAARANGKWVTILWFSNLDTTPRVMGSASGRAWIGFDRGDGHLALASIRGVGGKVSLTKGPVLSTNGGDARIVGSLLLYRPPEIGSELRSVPLLENGTLGSPSDVPGNPEKIPSEQYHPAVAAGLELGDRTVWVLKGGNGHGRTYMWACCSSAGGLSNLTQLVHQGPLMYSMKLGRDSSDRLWLSWMEIDRTVIRPVRLVELDPATLAPRTSSALTVPGVRTATAYDLACAAVCRVVVSRVEGDIVAWAPGERLTRVVPGTRTSPANLLGASYRSAGLAVGHSVSLPYNPRRGQVIAIRVVRGDARGAHARRVGSVGLPSVINPTDYDHYFMNQAIYGTFTADGLVFFATYDGPQGTRVVAGLNPVAR